MKAPLNERLGEAFVNKSYKALGLKLRPFSLWHLFLLTSGDSPFLEGKAMVGWRDLRWAISICRSKYPNVKWPSGWELAKSLLKCPYPDLGKELLNFNTYILDHYSAPLLWQKEGGITEQHDILFGITQVITALIGHGFSHEDAWNMPAGAAYWYFICIQKAKGAEVQIVSQGEIVAMEKVAKMRAKNVGIIGKN